MARQEGNLIRIMRPQLPECERIVPYLQEIDQHRWYSNFGPLVKRLERRFEEMFETGEGSVLTLASGTAALTNTLRAWNLPRGSICVVPAWTFMATAAAACAAELVPYFVDVDEETWAINPQALREQLRFISGTVSAVIVVAPFGYPVEVKEWDAFSEETGIHVIIDAAAGIDTVLREPQAAPSTTPVMISLHATKTFGVGEGGLIISTDTSLIDRVREMSNFGFSGRKAITIPGTNGKMSEYSAAVGHAALDTWEDKRSEWQQCTNWYIDQFEQHGIQHRLSRNWVTSTCNLRLQTNSADEVIERMVEQGIESRKWWAHGCHRHPAYGEYPRLPLPVTEQLARSVMALPLTRDLSEEDVIYIVETLHEIVGNGAR